MKNKSDLILTLKLLNSSKLSYSFINVTNNFVNFFDFIKI